MGLVPLARPVDQQTLHGYGDPAPDANFIRPGTEILACACRGVPSGSTVSLIPRLIVRGTNIPDAASRTTASIGWSWRLVEGSDIE
jgi:hypothetical protein